MDATSTAAHSIPHITLKPRPGWQVIDVREIIAYRDLFFFLIWRDIKVRYAQSVLGLGWAILQPVFQTGVITVIFGGIAKMDAPYHWPYLLFSFVGTLCWNLFSTGVNDAAGTLVGNANMISKVYFPRMLLPLTVVLGKLVDHLIGLVVLAGFMVYMGTSSRFAEYSFAPTPYLLILPALILLTMLSSAGVGMWLTSMAVQYRDVRYIMGFAIGMLMWGSPVVYSTDKVPDAYRLIYGLNPMVGVIEGFRTALLGSQPMPWDLLGLSALVSVVLFLSGALYFRRTERYFADVV